MSTPNQPPAHLEINTGVVGDKTNEERQINISPGSVITLFMHQEGSAIHAIRFNNPVHSFGTVRGGFKPFQWDTSLRCTNIDFYAGEHGNGKFNGLWMEVEGKRDGVGFEDLVGLRYSTKRINPDGWYTPTAATVWTEKGGDNVVGVQFVLKLTTNIEVGEKKVIHTQRFDDEVPEAIHYSNRVNLTSTPMEIKTGIRHTVTTTDKWTVENSHTLGVKLKAVLLAAPLQVGYTLEGEFNYEFLHKEQHNHEVTLTSTESEDATVMLQPKKKLEIRTKPPYSITLIRKVQIPMRVTWGDTSTTSHVVALTNTYMRKITNEVDYLESNAAPIH